VTLTSFRRETRVLECTLSAENNYIGIQEDNQEGQHIPAGIISTQGVRILGALPDLGLTPGTVLH